MQSVKQNYAESLNLTMMSVDSTTKYPELLGVVLCGGRATRMGGHDKGLVDFQKRPMASYAIDALKDCGQIVINANRNKAQYTDTFQLPVISDHNQDFAGPLAGMLAGLKYAQQHEFDWIISTPCDAPFVTTEYVQSMWHASQTPDSVSTKIFMAQDDKYRQPVFSMLHIDIIEALGDFLARGDKKIILFFEQVGYKTVSFLESQLFININSTTDLREQNIQSMG